MAADLSSRGKPVHVDPKPYVPRFTNVEMLFMSLQTQISQLKAEIDEAMAMAANAAVMPKHGEETPSSSNELAWTCSQDSPTNVSIIPGEVEVGADKVIYWAEATGTPHLGQAASTPTQLSLTETTYIVVDTDIADENNPTGTLRHVASLTPLTTEEKKHIRRKKIATITVEDGVIKKVEQWQCGNVSIVV